MRPWVADKRARRGRKRETGGCWAGWPRLAAALVGLAAAASWLGYGRPRGAAALKLSFFLFIQTEIEKEKHREKEEELEYKENILKLLELSTILINCIGHF